MVYGRDRVANVTQCARIAVILLAIVSGTMTVVCSGEDTARLRWDQRHISEYPIYKLLLKKGGYGNGPVEAAQWLAVRQKGADAVLNDETREVSLKEVLEQHAATEYADDAALLLARARLFYHNDLAGAIEDLYKVAAKYPKGSWIAEDEVFLRHAGLSDVTKDGKPRNGWYGAVVTRGMIDTMPEGKGRQEWEEVWTGMQEELAYLEYLESHWNYTADEARYQVAWIIVHAGLKDRMPEAEQVLQQVIEARRPDLRTKADIDAAKKTEHGEGITKYMDRTERKAHLLLIDLLLKQNKVDAAKAAAADYAKLHAGHASVEALVKRGLVEKQ